MASATPSRKLPKSNYHHSIVSAAAGHPGASKVPVDEAARHGDHGMTEVLGGPAFDHPDHVIPPPNYTGVEELVIVCCHAIFHPDADSPSLPLSSPRLESNWHLAPFQMSNPDTGKPGEHETFMAHITAGIDAIAAGVSNGGATKRALTALTEARSYYNAALADVLSQGHHAGGLVSKLFDSGRILLEEHATDSFQNLLFSVLLFRQTTGFYPKQVRVITHAFKSKRFLDVHAPTIQWPSNSIRVQGIDPIMSKEEMQDTLAGEEHYGYSPWKADPLGTGDVLSRKRAQRGYDQAQGKALTDGLEPSVKQLLAGEVPTDLPWRPKQKLKVCEAH
ncbi:hypothetical protein P154DRAFT_543776 [Amniculicola lignicola CBS 123094]|uniref:Uncharacterized protein n=1 Tax=Amniculicola lignicola CBS 123094 TaxID=1392246 RepID=A0A6A5WPG0_9PLEO|nr:hypothetical protein P154DRAFT_543776 [Amniculicola lignicola CBS 123094]